MECPNCGTSHASDVNYCKKCGMPIASREVATEAQANARLQEKESARRIIDPQAGNPSLAQMRRQLTAEDHNKNMRYGIMLVVGGFAIYVFYSLWANNWGPDFSWGLIGAGIVLLVWSFVKK